MANCKYCNKECKRKYCNYECYWASKKGKSTEHLKSIGFQSGNKINSGRIRKDVTERNINNNPMWNSNKQKEEHTPFTLITHNGYIMDLFKSHPNADSKGYVRRHRLVMERKIDRYLRDDEIVHHIDLDKKNNHIDNLKIMTKSTHMKLHSKLRAQ